MELLCIRDHSQGVVKAGNTYPFLGSIKTCSCSNEVYNVGIEADLILHCRHCGYKYYSKGVYWISSKLFAQIATHESEVEQEMLETV